MTIAVSEDFRNQAKIHAIQTTRSLKDYIIKAVRKQMEQDERKKKKPLKKEVIKALKQSIEDEKNNKLIHYKNAKDLLADI